MVMHMTFNHQYVGSNPAGPNMISNHDFKDCGIFFLILFCSLRRVFSEAMLLQRSAQRRLVASFAKRNASALRGASMEMSEKV